MHITINFNFYLCELYRMYSVETSPMFGDID